MTDQISAAPERTRGPGVVLASSVVAIVVLFLAHPAEQATDFDGFVKEEAANQVMSAIVHGGFMLVLGVQLACYAIFSGRLGWQRALVIAGLAFFAVGATTQMAGMFLDGILSPALAVRYLSGPPDRLAAARSIFTFCGVAHGLLGLVGMLFQAAAFAAWGAVLLRVSRAAGIVAVAVGLAMLGILTTAMFVNLEYSMLAIIGLLVWASTAGVLMIRRVV